jgi:hypothetical protein
MPILGPFVNAYFTVNAIDLSDHVRAITISDEVNAVDVTAMGAGFVQEAKGLRNAVITVTVLQDFTAAKVHATISPLIASSTPFIVEVRPVNAIRSATNPAALMSTAQVFTYNFLDGSIGEAAETPLEFHNAPGGAGITYPTA